MSKKRPEDPGPRMKRKYYEKELRALQLQTELSRLQDWIVHAGLRVVIVFEGRDAAGKGGRHAWNQSRRNAGGAGPP